MRKEACKTRKFQCKMEEGSPGNRRKTVKKSAAGMIQVEIKGKTCVFTSSCTAEGRGLGAFYVRVMCGSRVGGIYFRVMFVSCSCLYMDISVSVTCNLRIVSVQGRAKTGH